MKTMRIKIGILCLGILAMSQLAMTSALQPITEAFPSVSVATVQMLGSLPSIGGIVAALVIGPLSKGISNRWLALDGVLMVILGGLTPLVAHTNIYFLLVCAGLIGIGQSFITTMVPTLISEYFEDSERQKLIGIYQAMSSLGALIMTAAAGILATKIWSNVYYVYFIAVVVLVISAWFIPNDKIKSVGEARSETADELPKGKLPIKVYLIGGLSLVVTMMYTAFANNIGIYIGTAHLGNPAITGLVIAVGTVGGLITGLCVGILFKKIGHAVLFTALMCIGVPFIVIYFIANLGVIFVASFIAGAGMAMYQARAAFLMSNLKQPFLIPRAMAVFTFGNSLGGLISPVFFKLFGLSAGISSLLIAGFIGVGVGVLVIGTRFEQKAILD